MCVRFTLYMCVVSIEFAYSLMNTPEKKRKRKERGDEEEEEDDDDEYKRRKKDLSPS